MTRILVLLSLLFAATAQADSAEKEVHYLIDYVATSGCAFYRNGKPHPPEKAADHLRLKYRRGERWATSAEAFIDRLASASSITGKAYYVDCAGTEITAGPWLHTALEEYRRGQ